MQGLPSFPPQLCQGIFRRTVGHGSLRTAIQLQRYLARAGTWSCIMGDPVMLAAQRSRHSPGEGMEKYEKRRSTLLRPCEDLGQKSKSGRLSVLKPTTPTANNAYSFWRTGRGGGASRGQLLTRLLSDFVSEHHAEEQGHPSSNITPLSLRPSAPTVQSQSPKNR